MVTETEINEYIIAGWSYSEIASLIADALED